MTPKEIQQLIETSPTLEAALTMQKAHVWQFLRQEVLSCESAAPCPRCTRMDTLLVSPYAQDLCIECLLDELLIGGPILPEDKYYDPRSRAYNAEYATWEPSNILICLMTMMTLKSMRGRSVISATSPISP